MKHAILLLGSFLLGSMLLQAETLANLLKKAKEKDISLYVLQKENTLRFKQYELEDSKPGPVFSSSLQMTTADSQNLTGEIGVKQPLNDILGWTGDQTLKKQNRNLETFRQNWEYFQAEKKLEQDIIVLVKEILEKEKELLQQEVKISRKQLEWDTSVRFGTIGSGTAAELTLKMELNELKREQLRIELEQEESRFKLASRTEYRSPDLPELPSFELPYLPDEESRREPPSLTIEHWKLTIREEEIRRNGRNAPADLSLSGTLGASGDRSGGEITTAVTPKAGLSLEKKMSRFLDLNGTLSVGRDDVAFVVGLSWAPFAGKREKLKEEMRGLEAEKQNLIVEKALSSHIEKEEHLRNRIAFLKVRYENVKEDLEAAEQSVKELAFAREKGFIPEREERNGIIALETLKKEEQLLILESLNLQIEIDQYYYTEQ